MKNIVFWIPAIIFGILIFALSHQSHPPGGDSAPDYVLHFIEYGLFTLLVIIGVTRLFKDELSLKETIIVLVCVLIYAVIDEFHQTFIPNRDGSLRDWISDLAGASVFALSAWFFQNWIRGIFRR